MPVVEESIVVQQPAGVVFDFLVDPSNLPVWESSVVETHQIGDGPIVIGTRSEGVNKVRGVRFDWVSEVTELHRPDRVMWSAAAGTDRSHFTVAYKVEPLGSGARVTYRVEEPGARGRVRPVHRSAGRWGAATHHALQPGEPGRDPRLRRHTLSPGVAPG